MRRTFLVVALVGLLWVAAPILAQEARVERGGVANIGASLDKAWTIELDGEFDGVKLGRWTAKRYVYDGGGNSSLDLFENGGGCLRIARGKVYFLSATAGKIRNPDGEKDHYAIVKDYEGRHTLRIVYDPAKKRCQVLLDGSLAGDYALRIKGGGSIGRLSFPGFAGTVRLIQGGSISGGSGTDTTDTGKTGTGTTGGGNLDDVVNGGSGTEDKTMTAANPGTSTFVAPAPGTLKVTAKLSTYGPAEIAVVVSGAAGSRTWLSWKRNSAVDPSPLSVDGKPRADSIFEGNPGDYNPRETTVETKLQQGDTVTLKLEGDFGDGTPLLKHAFTKD